jgi:hypothetical protein
LGKIWRALEWKMLECFVVLWNILRLCSTLYDHLVIYVVVIWYIFSPIWYIVSIKIWQPCPGSKTWRKAHPRFNPGLSS